MKRRTNVTATARWQTRTLGAGLITTAGGWGLAQSAGHGPAGFGLVVLGLAVAGGAGYLRIRSATTGGGSRQVIGRWQQRSAKNGGTASWWDITRSSSRWAMRRKARVIRPSLRDVRWWRLWRVPALSYAVPLCRAGRQTVWTSGEESTMRIGIPGTGKTAELACRVLDAPGGVLVTSTAADLFELTGPVRERRGPVAVFNPGGIGGIPTSLRWSPLTGCADPATAARRAADLMGPPSASAEGERWDVQARRVLAVLLHAAALGGYRMSDVQAWIANPDTAYDAVLDALRHSPQPIEMSRAAGQALHLNPRTRDGVMLAMAPALAWVTHPAAAEAGDPRGGGGFTVADLTDRAGSLYLLGDPDGIVGPLVGALVAEIVYQGRIAAASRRGGRLDPGLTLVLDEMPLMCPGPVDRWMAEFRKFSIVLHGACQGRAQLRQVWGDNGASMIINTAAAVLIYGGCKDPDDLNLFTELAGYRDEETPVRDHAGQVTSTSLRRVPVIESAMLAGLPNHRALLVRRGMPVALVATPIGWNRRDVRRARRQPFPAPVDIEDRAVVSVPVPA